jgi:hypothetical protein
MAQPTQQDKVIAAALDVAVLRQEFVSLHNRAAQLAKRITVGNYLTKLNALPTASWAADGAVGAADGTPVAANPITTQGLYLPANDITGGVYMLNDFVAFMTNAAVSTSDRSGVAAKLIR